MRIQTSLQLSNHVLTKVRKKAAEVRLAGGLN